MTRAEAHDLYDYCIGVDRGAVGVDVAIDRILEVVATARRDALEEAARLCDELRLAVTSRYPAAALLVARDDIRRLAEKP